MADQPLALIVEDEAAVRRFLRAGFQSQGWRVIEATSGGEAASLAMQYVPDVVLLDLGLPDMDGLDVLRRIRAWSALPVLVLSARGQERQKVEALDAGADDYVTKPFGFAELLARVRATVRRATRPEAVEPVVRAGALSLDLERRRVTLGGREVHLTPMEYRLLAVLARSAGKVVTHQQLIRAVWGPAGAEHGAALRVHMTHLRRKLEHEGRSPFATEAGVGYRLSVDEP